MPADSEAEAAAKKVSLAAAAEYERLMERKRSLNKLAKAGSSVGKPGKAPKGSVVAKSEPSDEEEGKEWEVESIHGRRVFNGTVQYRIKWQGCGMDECTWQVSEREGVGGGISQGCAFMGSMGAQQYELNTVLYSHLPLPFSSHPHRAPPCSFASVPLRCRTGRESS